MSGRMWLVLGVAAAAIVVALLFGRDPHEPTAKSDATREIPVPTDSVPAPAIDDFDASTQVGPATSTTDTNDRGINDAAFRVDGAGALVLDEQTRLNIEALLASTDAHNLYAETREQTASLPPAAARLAEELVDKFVQYQRAQRQAYPPDVAPPTPEDAVRELEGLHALREAHFGPEVARQFYGKEESIAREMIEVMRLENDQSLTPQERLERARELRERLPGVAAIEKSNRDSATEKQKEEK